MDEIGVSGPIAGKRAAVSQIWELANECAALVDRSVALAATDFIQAIPDGLPLPEVSLDPDGEQIPPLVLQGIIAIVE